MNLTLRFRIVILIVLCTFSVFHPSFVAHGFNPNRIISDEEINDAHTMSLADIADFLRQWGSSLQFLVAEDFDGITKTAAEIIWLASERYDINPRYTLVLLQKEQGLIEKNLPTQRDLDWATGYGVCDSCTTNDPSIQKFRGFGKQIDNGVGFMRFFYENPDKASPFLIGVPATVIDSLPGGKKAEYTVIPQNQATANLYKYTPHYHGNNLFSSLWKRYFGKGYPDGTLVKSEYSPDVFVIKDGLKRHITSFSVLISRYNPERIVPINESDLNSFPEGPAVLYPQFSYLKSPEGAVYLIIDDKRHVFSSNETLRVLGINPEEVIDVTEEDLLPYDIGKPITIESAYPTGALLQDSIGGTTYYVENGERYPIYSPDILHERFSGKHLTSVTPEELSKYVQKNPVTFSEGALVKSPISSVVYVISDGLRREIPSEETFLSLGFQWGNIITVSEQALSVHALGAPLM